MTPFRLSTEFISKVEDELVVSVAAKTRLPARNRPALAMRKKLSILGCFFVMGNVRNDITIGDSFDDISNLQN